MIVTPSVMGACRIAINTYIRRRCKNISPLRELNQIFLDDFERLLIKNEGQREQASLLSLKYKTALDDSKALNEKYTTLAEHFDRLSEKYRRVAVSNTNVLSLDLGIGLTGSGADDAVGLVGVGFKI